MNLPGKIIIFISLIFINIKGYSQKDSLVFLGSSDNDLYKTLQENNFAIDTVHSLKEAVALASERKPIFVMADQYPQQRTEVDISLLESAIKNKIKVYIEYPSSLPHIEIGDSVIDNYLLRGIVTSSAFGEELKPMSILGINDCHLLTASVDSPLIVLGKVAGFDRAVYGLKDTETYPVLFKQDNLIVAMTKLSDYATGRYGPAPSWERIWSYILSQMFRGEEIKLKHWQSIVHPTYEEKQRLPENAVKRTVAKGVNWYFNARLLIDSIWEKQWKTYQGNGLNPVGPPIDLSYPSGNGRLGIIEGPTSKIYENGTQAYRYWVRADDQGEAAYALSAASSFLDDTSRYDKVAENLIDYIFKYSNLRSGEKAEKNSPVYGLIGWAVTHPGVFYGDDNARCVLGIIGASAYLNTNKWDQQVVENILSNFRTTGKKGFRSGRLEENDILKNGWEYYWDRNIENPHPHFESWMWALYLWLYDKTGYKPLLERTKKAIQITMEDYPDNWKWTNGIQQERARMILPLAWLVRVEDTREHRVWLDKMVEDLLSFQVSNGAIREELGSPDKGQFGAAKSNAAYGKTEAPLIFENGDPIADMLYTSNFAFFSLNEAYHATGNKKYKKAVEKLSDFLVRIQVSSNKIKSLDGAWFRAFDYRLWDYWASNADAGWGAWATLTGWIQSWIVTTLVLVNQNQSYWKLTENAGVNKEMNKTLKVMFPGGINE